MGGARRQKKMLRGFDASTLKQYFICHENDEIKEKFESIVNITNDVSVMLNAETENIVYEAFAELYVLINKDITNNEDVDARELQVQSPEEYESFTDFENPVADD